jgi:glutathione S-transferase
MRTLHIANKNYSSWSLRPWLLMRELGIAFEERMHPFATGEDFTRFSPSGKVPCLHEGELVVWDSLAIVETLAESHPAVWPSDPVARAWARSAAAEMHSGFAALRQHCSMSCGVRIRLHRCSAALGRAFHAHRCSAALGRAFHAHPPALARDVARIEALFAEGQTRFGGPFLAGASFSAVDAFFAPVAFRVQTYALALSDLAAAYVARMLALPGMQQWYAEALAEPWRDEMHELELREAGECVADHRE